ncbi:MAG: UvrD-helicase domain-containing protein [Oscillospiraceae bacterium]|nr:UvrD-helicase domain-containing protein [Oscillospiraceae bacterium]
MLTHELEQRFCRARRWAIARDFATLNAEQQQAVLATEGPLLLLAGAGSGKTTVLIHRIANLIRYGCGSDSVQVPDGLTEEDVAFLEGWAASPDPAQRSRMEALCRMEPAAPWSILAITFTNKAAGELKERLERMLGPQANDIWASTFHSACVRILRRDIERLGFSSSFTIYDTDDSQRVIKDILKEANIDERNLPPRSILTEISRAKDEMLLAADYAARHSRAGDWRKQIIANVYREYERRLWEASALDFDDIILHTVRLLRQEPEVCDYYRRKFRYVLIDEYQDTNNLQYLLASTLAGGYENFCVVGDDDQSIYRFRGATIENILSFEKQYPNCRVIRLEQNYRSTANILGASNAVIRNNQGRKGKELWTKAEDGSLLQLYTAMNEHDEAHYILSQILTGLRTGRQEKDYAILYRSNSVTNILYQTLVRNGINVYMRHPITGSAEVKDVMAYLFLVQNGNDDLRFKRIINKPTRGIGDRTVDTLQQLAQEEGVSMFALLNYERLPDALSRSGARLEQFRRMILDLREKSDQMTLPEFYDYLLQATGYLAELEEKDTPENKRRKEHLMDFKNVIYDYVANAAQGDVQPTLAGFLEELVLDEELGAQDEDDSREQKPKEERVQMMTMHAAKGLEFPVVFLIAMEDGVFPSDLAIGEPEEMEEERRICYVAMTRAKKQLYLTNTCQRMRFGQTRPNRPSRFVQEIPEQFLERSGRSSLDRDMDDFNQDWTPGIPSRSSGYGGYQNPYRTGFGGNPYSRPASPRPAAPVSSRPAASTASRSAQPTGAARYPIPGRTPASSAPKAAPAAPSAAPKAPMLQLSKGDMVQHKAFGKGMVTSAQKVGGDVMVEVAFDNVGTKRLMLKFASAQMTKL